MQTRTLSRRTTRAQKAAVLPSSRSSKAAATKTSRGANAESNCGPLPSEGRIIPLDHTPALAAEILADGGYSHRSGAHTLQEQGVSLPLNPGDEQLAGGRLAVSRRGLREMNRNGECSCCLEAVVQGHVGCHLGLEGDRGALCLALEGGSEAGGVGGVFCFHRGNELGDCSGRPRGQGELTCWQHHAEPGNQVTPVARWLQ